MISLLPYIFYCFLIGFHQIILKDITALYAFEINLPALIVVLIAMHKTEIPAVWFGFTAGIIVATVSPELMGWHALFLAVIAYVTSHLSERMNLESFFTRITIVVAAIFLHSAFTEILLQSEAFYDLLILSILPGTIYTSLVASVYFLLEDGKFSIEKLKESF